MVKPGTCGVGPVRSHEADPPRVSTVDQTTGRPWERADSVNTAHRARGMDILFGHVDVRIRVVRSRPAITRYAAIDGRTLPTSTLYQFSQNHKLRSKGQLRTPSTVWHFVLP